MPGQYNETMFARSLKRAIRDADVSQRELADAVGVGQQTVSKWVTGHATPRLKTIRKLERALDVPEGALVKAAGYHLTISQQLDPEQRTVGRLAGFRAIPELETGELLDQLDAITSELRRRLHEAAADSPPMLRAAYDAEVNDGDEGVDAVTEKIKKRRGLE